MVGSVSQLEIDRHLELGREFLAKGQLQDALSHYHAAVGKSCLRAFILIYFLVDNFCDRFIKNKMYKK